MKRMVYGVNSVLALPPFAKILVLQTVYNRLKSKLEKFSSVTVLEKQEFLRHISDDLNHQGIVAFVQSDIKVSGIDSIKNQENRVVLLDAISDVGNVGNIVRSSVAFGFSSLIYTKHDMPDVASNPVIEKTSVGTLSNLNLICHGNINDAILRLKKANFWIVGLDGSGTMNLNEFALKYHDEKICIVLGSEGKGLRPRVKQLCDVTVFIKTTSLVESLNVSTAAGICFSALFS